MLVETRDGSVARIRGKGVLWFGGILYALAVRWEPPRSPTSWPGVQVADAFGSVARRLGEGSQAAAYSETRSAQFRERRHRARQS